RMTACFPVLAEAGTEDELVLRGDTNAWTWAGKQIKDRRRKRQVLIRLCDGQPSLWAASDICLELDVQRDLESKSSTPSDEGPVVDILDIIHVAGYVWAAARAFFGKAEAPVERFVRERLLRILQGEVLGVITGMRAMATRRKLSGEKLKEIAKTCNYFENNLERMRYGEYLSGGYPIASGVIEGACRHLVKDRMERTGMRWQQPSAGSMLFVRSLAVTGLWDEFQSHRQAEQQAELHPHRSILEKYTPAITLAA
ncbi:MAG: hypothetical protein KDB27_01385, partial [Planctomycetales bacterium]|nr:hypothetical protein [Planctomycetales bacterium]